MGKIWKEYIVIGAGPSGIQLGYYLKKNKLDYCILEKNDCPGSFFKKYPRDRELISINKVYTGYDDKEINLRWDWNSLLCDNPDLLFKNYSKDYFPIADDLVRYLNDFAEYYKLNVQYNSNVQNIRKDQNDIFHITSGDIEYSCKYLIIASGIPKQITPDIEGMELCEYYSDCSINPDDYINQKVLIIGKGNSGFETANNLTSTAATIHLLSPENISFAWKTHYVGHLRAVNNNFLDTYLLKSQNAILNGEIRKIRKDQDGKYLVSINYTKVRDSETEEIKYDRVIIACGFKMDDSFFDVGFQPNTFKNGKLPELTSEWESTNIQNLYFAGVLSHSRDFKKSTSGFIHGYRYNCRALINILLNKNHEGEFKSYLINDFDEQKITDLIIQKINSSSALWQQFGFIGDVLIIDRSRKAANYIESLPCDYINEKLCHESDDYFIVTLEYGSNKRDPFSENVERITRFDSDNAVESDFLHPVIRKFSKGNLISEFHLIEDLDGEFNRKEHVEPLLNYLKSELVSTTQVRL